MFTARFRFFGRGSAASGTLFFDDLDIPHSVDCLASPSR